MRRREGTDKKQEHRISNHLRKRLYTLPEAAEYLGRTVWGIRNLVWSGKIPVVQDGRRQFIDVFDLEAYVERNKRILQ